VVADRGHMLAEVEVDPLHERGVDLPATHGQHLLDRRERAEYHAVRHADQAPAPHGFHHLRIEQLRQGLSTICQPQFIKFFHIPTDLVVAQEGLDHGIGHLTLMSPPAK
jgi:hypothetical protein